LVITIPHVHSFVGISEVEPDIDLSTCACGFVEYFQSLPHWDAKKDEKIKARVNRLNWEAGAEWRKNQPQNHIPVSNVLEKEGYIEQQPKTQRETPQESTPKSERATDATEFEQEEITMELTPVPEKPKNIPDRKAYYDSHKEQILTEIKENGLKSTLKRWNISQGTWTARGGLNERWGLNIPWPYMYQKIKGDSKKSKKPNTTQSGVDESKLKSTTVDKSIPADTISKIENAENLGNYGIFLVNRNVPAFPAFNEGWNDEVKLQWFEVYKYLAELTRIPVNQG
jgi:hypothetical protein